MPRIAVATEANRSSINAFNATRSARHSPHSHRPLNPSECRFSLCWPQREQTTHASYRLMSLPPTLTPWPSPEPSSRISNEPHIGPQKIPFPWSVPRVFVLLAQMTAHSPSSPPGMPAVVQAAHTLPPRHEHPRRLSHLPQVEAILVDVHILALWRQQHRHRDLVRHERVPSVANLVPCRGIAWDD